MFFFESFLGHYLAQAVFYSLIAVIVIETMMSIWHITEPLLRIEFRLLALFLPVLCPPVYYLIYPPRNTEYFRERVALIDVNQWLSLELGGNIAVWYFFAAMLAVTTVLFFIKEALPLARHHLGNHPSFPVIKKGQFPKLDAVLASLSQSGILPIPTLLLFPEKIAVAYSSGYGSLVLSATMIDLLDVDELQAAIAHEMAHHSRQVTWVNRILLILRYCLFYNPIALLIFHRVINDSEKLCDDMAVRFSGKRLSLTSGLLKIFRHSAAAPSTTKRRLRSRIASLENTARRNLTRERIRRITQPDGADSTSYGGFRIAITGLMLAGLFFFVV